MGAISRWIDSQLQGTSVTVVLIGAETSSRPWVQYEIKKSIELGKGLLGVRIHAIKHWDGSTGWAGANPLPYEYAVYDWYGNNGYVNLATWIEQAALAAGR